LKANWKLWNQFRVESGDQLMEINVSWRDPIDHLMSQRCNLKRGNFRVEQTSNLKKISRLCSEGPNGSILQRVDANEECTTKTF